MEDDDENPRPLKRGPGGFWVLENGTPLERLFQSPALKTVMAIKLTPSFGYGDLAQLEKTSKQMKEWVQKNRLWEVLVQRDYPDQFVESFDLAHPSHMRHETRHNLGGRTETHWKRLYELNVRGARLASPPGPSTSGGFQVLSGGREIRTGPGAQIFLPANSNIKDSKGARILLYVWRDSNGQFPETMTYLSNYNVSRPLSKSYVGESPFSAAVLGKQLAEPGDGKITIPLVHEGILSFMSIYIGVFSFRVFFWVPNKEIELVSHCISFDCSNPAKAICGVCKTAPYCSVKCQKRDWERHRKECRSE